MKQKVVVIGHGYTSRLGMIRALGREGYEVIVIVITGYMHHGKKLNTTRPIDCYSKYVSQVFFSPSDRETLVQLLLSKCVDHRQKVVIIPDSDFSAATVDENAGRLTGYFLFPHIKHRPGEIVTWMDKLKQKELAVSVGLNVAEGFRIKVENGELSIPKDLHYPCFPKPLATIVGGKGGLRRCNDEKALREVLESLLIKDHSLSVLIEDYKDIEAEYALLGVSDGKKVIIPGIIQAISLANGVHYGVTRQGRIINNNGYDELIGKFNSFVLQTGFVGLFDIDFYKSAGKFYFCEMNFRYGGSGYAYTAMGVNLPVMLVKLLLGERIDLMQQRVEHGAVFVNERMCFDDWYSRYLSTKEYRQMLRSADISFISDTEDMVPQFKFSLLFMMYSVKRMIKSCLGNPLLSILHKR